MPREGVVVGLSFLSPTEWAFLGAFFLLGIFKIAAVLSDAEAERRAHGEP